jgi:hypothetical protein
MTMDLGRQHKNPSLETTHAANPDCQRHCGLKMPHWDHLPHSQGLDDSINLLVSYILSESRIAIRMKPHLDEKIEMY